MATMRAVEVGRVNGPLALVEREVPTRGARQVRLRVQARGICHGDTATLEGGFPGLTYPRVPGHEIAGVVDAVGPDVVNWRPGQRAGLGWHGGYCADCRRGEFFACATGTQATGITFDGGFAE